MKWRSLFAFFLLFSSTLLARPPKGFVSIAEVDPTIIVEARYFGRHNFIGKPIRGYYSNKCILTQKAAQALARVQKELTQYGLSLKVYDCYRPQQAVNHFVAWAKKLNDTKMKSEFFPSIKKASLFQLGYIASKSGHSRGSTLDLTLVNVPASKQPPLNPKKLLDCRLPYAKRFADNSLDMGTGFDCFDPLSHTANPRVGRIARTNRLLLKSTMEKFGFHNYDKEWWHYTLKGEPYPNRYFNFPVK